MSDIADKAEQLKGKAKEKMGDWTGDQGMEKQGMEKQGMEKQGMAEEAKAKAEKAAEDAKDKAREKFNL